MTLCSHNHPTHPREKILPILLQVHYFSDGHSWPASGPLRKNSTLFPLAHLRHSLSPELDVTPWQSLAPSLCAHVTSVWQ